eukprot:scaffold2023_cov70-Phaeocystis_antarctica.AAC.3
MRIVIATNPAASGGGRSFARTTAKKCPARISSGTPALNELRSCKAVPPAACEMSYLVASIVAISEVYLDRKRWARGSAAPPSEGATSVLRRCNGGTPRGTGGGCHTADRE